MVVSQTVIEDPLDILELDIIDFNRLNGHWQNPREAVETIFSWFNRTAWATVCDVEDFHHAPGRLDMPEWRHVGNHAEVGQKYWNWFWWVHGEQGADLRFADAPDFSGRLSDGSIFRGDIGKVSASTFAMAQKQLRAHDMWVSVLGDGTRHVAIEPFCDISRLWGCGQFWGKVVKGDCTNCANAEFCQYG